MNSFVYIFVTAIAAQEALSPQSNTFNSSFALSDTQIQKYGLNSTTANNINVAVNFERTNWATGSVDNDSFYDVPTKSAGLPPGSVLKVENFTNTTTYTLPPNVALSRFLFQSETLNGSTVPASAYVLWPWMPRIDPSSGKYAVVGWAHGTSGIEADCAPSHIKNLWYQYSAPYTLALQGYVVVAPDYAGLGVDKYANGTAFKHPYLNNAAAANDLFYAVEAAQKAFPSELSSRFVLMGHSQGGGAAWAAAQRQYQRPVQGYLGTIAGSPVTNVSEFPPDDQLAITLAWTLGETIAGFSMSEFLTPKGVQYAELLYKLSGCNSVVDQLVSEEPLSKHGWQISPSMRLFANLTGDGGRPITGPMLVLQGTADSSVPVATTNVAVNATCDFYPKSNLEYALFEGADHVPTLFASQRIWLDWIADRFADKKAGAPCKQTLYQPARDVESYQKELAYFLEIATDIYEVA